MRRLAATLLIGCGLFGGGCRTAATPPRPAATTTPAAAPARAFRVERAEDLLPGPAATGAIGDFRLDNGLVAFVITDAPIAFGFADSGGNLVDAARVDGRDSLSQVFLYLDDTFPRQAIYETVAVDEAQGARARVIARGHDSADPQVRIVTSYELGATDDYLTIRTVVENGGRAPLAEYEIGDAISWGQAEHFLPGRGFEFRGPQQAPWLAGLGDGVAYGYTQRTGPLGGPHGSSWSDPILVTTTLAAGASATVERYLIVGGRGELGAVLGRIHDLRDEPTALLSGTVTETGGAALAGARVQVWDRDLQPVAVGETGDDGTYALPLPVGDYRLGVSAPGRTPRAARPDPTVVTLGADGLVHSFTVGEPARLRYTITSDGAPSPAKLTFRGISPTTDPYFGPTYRAAGAGNVTLTASGTGTLVLPPGHYRVAVSRGLEFDLVEREIIASAGQTVELTAALSRVVDTTGYVSGDFHQHAIPSPDSAVALGDRVVANLAEGVEIAIATDHNQITDYAPAAAALAGAAPLVTVVGLEATTETLGHFIAFPLRRDPRQGRGGAPNVHHQTVPEIFALLRALGDDLVLQVNHPRSGKSGYFDIAGFDPEATTAQPAGVALGFDALEVVNGKRIDTLDRTLRDWFWLLAHGHVVTAMGNSDSHAIIGEECGYPRNFLGVGTDDPRRVDEQLLREVVKRTRDVIVTNGPFVTIRVGGKSAIGRTFARKSGAALTVEITVQAAAWVDVDRVEIYANGKPFGAPIAVTAGRDQVVRWQTTADWQVTADTWFVVIVRGDDSLAPVIPPGDGRPVTPVALTNPIWIDVP